MTKQQSLDELKKLAMPALRHVELVYLARRESPNRADKVASSLNWPCRQVKAVRSLAILRRDYGLEAFEAFVVEHTRSGNPDTEHAQKEKETMSKERILKSVARLFDAVRKLIVLLLHGFKEEAWTYINQLIEQGEAAFWLDNGREAVIEPDGTESDSRCLTLCLSAKKLEHRRDMHRHIRLNFTSLVASGYDNKRVVTLVRQVVETTLALGGKSSGHYWWVAVGTTQACRDFLPPNDELTKRAIIQQIEWRGEDFEFWNMREYLDPQYQKETNLVVVMEAVCARLLELGMTAELVRALYTKWLGGRQGENLGYMPALASCSVFEEYENERDAAVHVHLPEYWQELVNGQLSSKGFQGLNDFGLYSAEDNQFFRSHLVKFLSEGNATKCFELLVTFNREFGLDGLKQYADRDEIRRWARKMLDELAHDAFDVACQAGRFGTAAALTQHFNCVNEAQLKKAANLLVESRMNEVGVSVDDGDCSVDEAIEYIFERLAEDGPQEDDSVFLGLKVERDEYLAASVAARRQEVGQATQVAIDLFQPIKLNFEPNWS